MEPGKSEIRRLSFLAPTGLQTLATIGNPRGSTPGWGLRPRWGRGVVTNGSQDDTLSQSGFCRIVSRKEIPQRFCYGLEGKLLRDVEAWNIRAWLVT